MKHILAVILFLVSLQFLFAQDKPDGPYKEFYDSGELKMKGQYENNKRTGEWTVYHKNGQISNISTFTEGEKEIPEISYFENGDLRRVIKKQGNIYVEKEYYESGSLFFERAHESGYYKEFREDSTLKVEANYNKYQLYGKWKSYDENGKLKWSVSYEDGVRNGIYQNFYANGVVKTEGVILNDRKHGEEKRFNENGKLIWKGHYENGEFSKTWINYNEKGKKIRKVNTKKEALKLTPTKVPNGLLERVPIFPGCDEVYGNNARRKCMSQGVAQHIVFNFDKNVIANLGLSPGRKRIYVMFKIDKLGRVQDIQARGPHPKIELEAKRIIKMLPNLVPGYQRGKPVVVPYSLPIVFRVE